MSDTSVNNQRIAKNTLMLYLRMILLMAVNLYTSRIVLQALGIENYGIYNAVAGFITMFSMVSASLSTAISRYLTFVLGEGNRDKLHIVFNTSIIIQLFLSLLIVILVETIGVWFLNTKMTIPSDSMAAANWVLQFALITFIFNLLSVPYNALLIAHEHMSAFAYIGIVEGIANLLAAFVVLYSHTNSLILYAAIMCIVAIGIRIIYTAYCKKHFKESAFEFKFDGGLLKHMFGFAGWNFFGSISGILRSQGINILFNIYNGPAVNAARGLAVQVNSAVTKFSTNFYTAVQPQITKLFASGNTEESCKLVIRSSRLSFYLLMFISLPVIFEIDFLLNIWLSEVPKHTGAFIQIIVINSLYDSFSQPLIHLMLATGNIKKYQVVVGCINLLNFPVAWLILKVGFAPEIAQSSVVIFTLLALFARIKLLKKMVGISERSFLIETVLKCTAILILSSIVPAIIIKCLHYGWSRFILNIFFTESISLTIIFFIGLTRMEKKWFLNKIESKFIAKHK